MSHTFHIILTDDRFETVIADGYELDTDTGYVNFHNGVDTIASFAMRSVDGVTEEPEEVVEKTEDCGMGGGETPPQGTEALDEYFANGMLKFAEQIAAARIKGFRRR